ncbi:hypothetical protein ASY01nite_14210 [Acetobacter syzygii]|uniref:hypothetical protein n=1 Tax=Acetobacter syzygii TaxID=146476 RepID=UPI0005E8923E|nr:hypothetical protein [Acetobacter syzygii]GAN72135.1 hypothetical protein Absy_030_043 [Acetobacter syzygii]GBR64964.1 hypothetical protein AA0483_1623 [Acetobacter syzygii NRIC 0483]GEL56355.1 hypothetical protein ASY01nite_14210 [Acetobacter syzygii]
MQKETEFGTVEYGGAYALDTLNVCDAMPSAMHDTPFLWQTTVRAAELWSWLHPYATIQQRRELLEEVARKLGIEDAAMGMDSCGG